MIKDLGSTNGTYVNRAPIQESSLISGQTVHLGAVEMTFYSDGPAPAPTPAAHTPPSVRMVGAPVRATPAPVAVSVSTTSIPAVPVAAAPPPPIPPAIPGAQAVGPGKCKHHPKTQGRFFCGQCKAHYCELCVNTRTLGGIAHRYCRHCGSECLQAEVEVVRSTAGPGFFSQLPAAFIYPFRGTGILVLVVSALLFTALDFLVSGLFGIAIFVIATGYLFSYMQNIIQSTAAEDKEMPELPGFDGVLASFGRLIGAVLMSFGIAIVVGVIGLQRGEAPNLIALVGALAFGCLYFPMALLAVCMKDSVAAANPLVVVPAILKAPLEYIVAVIIMGAVVGVRMLGEVIVAGLAGQTFTTRNMGVLVTALAVRALWSLAVVYFLSVNMRILGLLYVTKKRSLGWFSR